METGTLTAFDIGVLLVIGLSTLFAFGRGFATAALSFGAWAGAFVATVFGFAVAQPYGRDYIKPPELADIATLAILFFVSLFILKYLAEAIGGKIKQSPIGFLDRSLGALFGLLRGMVIVSVAYLAFDKVMPGDNAPDWVQTSKSRPLVAWGAEMIEGFAAQVLGKDPTTVGSDYLQKAASSVPSQFLNEKMEEQAAKYLKDQRKNLDGLLETIEDDAKKKKAGS